MNVWQLRMNPEKVLSVANILITQLSLTSMCVDNFASQHANNKPEFMKIRVINNNLTDNNLIFQTYTTD